MPKKVIHEEIELGDGVQATLQDKTLTLKGTKGEISEVINDPMLLIKVDQGKIILTAKADSRNEKRMVKTYKAKLKNNLIGVNEGYTYKLKICSGHFPMNVGVNGTEFTIKNFLGEKVPRTITLKEGASVKIEGEQIIVESIDKEKAGQVAADIEQLTRVTNRDNRIFQDGIYITEKANKELK
ncbi:MAG: 50S ribosomal protein L6 [Candidatus Woesearchaeota archaeon]|jgi:large subunit ribosomal protein L6|nr:50S ribosomal protein L6 [Candidatus Woesearchaeota archaeon]MDP7457955.1 50S ribosomal protein L6 [Candidatus Woesearchaeota archaeon]